MPRQVRFDVGEFLEACRIARSEGGGAKEVAALLGINEKAVTNRSFVLRRKGVPVPMFRRGRRKAVRAAKVRRQVAPACRPALSFVIHVNGGAYEV